MKKLDLKALMTVLLAVLVNRSVLLMMNPFGVAYFAAAYMYGNSRIFLILASLAGMATVLPVRVLLKYAGVMLGIVVIEKILKINNRKVPVWGMAVATGMMVFTAGCAYILGVHGGGIYQLKQAVLSNLFEGIGVFCLIFIFHKAVGVLLLKPSNDNLTNQEQLSIGILIAASLYALSGLDKGTYGIVPAVIFFLLFYIGYKYGSGAATIAGGCGGIVLAVSQNDVGLLGYMCLIGITAGAFREGGRLISATAVAALVAFLNYFGVGYMGDMTTIRAIVAAIIVFLLLPERLVSRNQNDTGIQQEIHSPAKIELDMAKQRLKMFARAFKQLSGTFRQQVLPRVDLSGEEVDEAFDELTRNVCLNCSQCELCWEREYEDSLQSVGNILNYYSKNGHIEKSQVPIAFHHRCIRIDGFLEETGRVLEIAKLNLNWKNRLMESRLAIAGQFQEVADIIDDFSDHLEDPESMNVSQEEAIKSKLSRRKMQVKGVSVIPGKNKGMRVLVSGRMKRGRFVTAREICSILKEVLNKTFVLGKGCRMVVSNQFTTYEFVEDTCYQIIEGAAMCPKVSQDVSGDAYTFLEMDNGQVVMSLSDGMGTGTQASEESQYIISLMESLMDSGFGKKSIVHLMNSMMFLKSDRKAFSTVDMSIINLYNGECSFIKIGGAASYIKYENQVEEIMAETLPIGVFTELDYEEIKRKLGPGDMIVMVTDGIINSGVDVKAILETMPKQSPQETADWILAEAVAKNGVPGDDMTVIAAGVYEK